MNIIEKNNVFIIETDNTHYVFGVNSSKRLCHIHWGKKVPLYDYKPFDSSEKNSNHSELDFEKGEYTPFGGTMYHENSIKATYYDGCRDTVLRYKSYSITKEDKSMLLSVTMIDEVYGLSVDICYRAFENSDIIERFALVKNNSDKDILLEKVATAEFCLPDRKPYYSVNTNGSWGGEFRLETQTVKNGSTVYESRKGTSSHNNSPYFILSQNANEDFGEVYFGALSWSGNFKVEISRDFAGVTRSFIGINDFDFSYTLKPLEEFSAPSVYCGYSYCGYSSMSNMMNKFAVAYILPREFADKPLPVLYNSWEATGFDVNTKDQLSLAKAASKIGCELFVMDDGWFGDRNNDRAGLGDWTVNTVKFPKGLSELIDGVNKLGLDFGLWFEPEMVNPDSNLYRNHPDWTYHYEKRTPSCLRHQLVLNMTKREVQEYVFKCLDDMLSNYNIKYIKWDMNRPFSEIGAENLDNEKELWYRHTKAVYNIIDRLKSLHSHVQFESCSSGGGRADIGALSHSDMVWTSDNTDPIDRLYIQQGYSMLYPIKCMRAWVTDTNKCSRPVPWNFRFSVSQQGSLSLGGNLNKYTPQELDECKKQVELYKRIRDVIQFGDFYRLMTFDSDNAFATQYVNEKKSVLFVNGKPTSFFNDRFFTVKCKGLKTDKMYTVFDVYENTSEEHSGGFLMNVGITEDFYRPLSSKLYIIDEKEQNEHFQISVQ